MTEIIKKILVISLLGIFFILFVGCANEGLEKNDSGSIESSKTSERELKENIAFYNLRDRELNNDKEGKNLANRLEWSRKEVIVSRGEYARNTYPTKVIPGEEKILFSYLVNNPENISWASIYYLEEEEATSYYYYDVTEELLAGKMEILLAQNDFSSEGGDLSWEKINYFRIAFQSQEGKQTIIHPLEIKTLQLEERATVPLVTLFFDDGWKDNYTRAYEIMKKIDPEIVAQLAIIPSRIGEERYLTREETVELHEAGWEISNHTYTHPYLTELSEEEIEEEVLAAYEYVREIDEEGAKHLAVPYSAVSPSVVDKLRELTVTARYIPGGFNDYRYGIDRHALYFMEVTSRTEFVEVEAWINKAIEEKTWLILLFHRIEDPAEDRYAYSREEYAKLITHLSDNKEKIQTVTVSGALDIIGY